MYRMYAIPPNAAEISVTAARAQLSDLVNRVVYGGEVVVLTRHGRPVAALLQVAESREIAVAPPSRAVGFKLAERGSERLQPDEMVAAEHRADRGWVGQPPSP